MSHTLTEVERFLNETEEYIHKLTKKLVAYKAEEAANEAVAEAVAEVRVGCPPASHTHANAIAALPSGTHRLSLFTSCLLVCLYVCVGLNSSPLSR